MCTVFVQVKYEIHFGLKAMHILTLNVLNISDDMLKSGYCIQSKNF
jgi:hypothetical protein